MFIRSHPECFVLITLTFVLFDPELLPLTKTRTKTEN